MYMRFGTARLGGHLRSRGQIFEDLLAVIHVKVTNRSFKIDFIRDNVIAHAAFNNTKAHYRWRFSDIDLARNDGLRIADDLACSNNRVNPTPRSRTMGLTPFNMNFETV